MLLLIQLNKLNFVGSLFQLTVTNNAGEKRAKTSINLFETNETSVESNTISV